MSSYKRNKLSPLGRPRAVLAGLVLIGCSVDARSLGSYDDYLLASDPTDGGAGGDSGTSTGGSVGGNVSPDGGMESDAGSGRGGDSGGSTAVGANGGSTAVGANGGSSGVGPSGGSSGVGPSGGSPAGGERGDGYGAGGCGDLDGDAVQDCKETLLTNARFNRDESGWQAEPNVAVHWDPRNARPDQASGALAVTNGLIYEGEGMTLGGSRQCQPVLGGTKYSVAARAFIPSGQGEASAGISIFFYGIDDCADYFLSAAAPIMMVSGPDAWGLIEGTVKAPLAARSAYVRLVTVKPFKQAPTKALFDDVLVREE